MAGALPASLTDKEPGIAKVIGLLLRMIEEQAYGSVAVEFSRGRIKIIRESRTYKLDADEI